MGNHYPNFDSLLAHERDEVDYRIRSLIRRAAVLIMAPHGGGIEPGTSEIALAIAGEDHSLFMFEGIKASGNWRLHIASDRYNLPQACTMARNCDRLVSIHGCREEDAIIYVGGLDMDLGQHIRKELIADGFAVDVSPRSGLGGRAQGNICNGNSRGAGVQLEISRGQRKRMFRELAAHARGEVTDVFSRFCEAVRAAIAMAQRG